MKIPNADLMKRKFVNTIFYDPGREYLLAGLTPKFNVDLSNISHYSQQSKAFSRGRLFDEAGCTPG